MKERSSAVYYGCLLFVVSWLPNSPDCLLLSSIYVNKGSVKFEVCVCVCARADLTAVSAVFSAVFTWFHSRSLLLVPDWTTLKSRAHMWAWSARGTCAPQFHVGCTNIRGSLSWYTLVHLIFMACTPVSGNKKFMTFMKLIIQQE